MAIKHIAHFNITQELLVQALHESLGMPQDTVIVHVKIETHWSGRLQWLTLYVEHPDLLPVREGEQVARIMPTITERDEHPPKWEWGVDDG